jgi:asparagine synthase (glutamine-hydrolysing)
MCGIAGYIGGKREEKPTHLKRMLSCLKHRGPDEMGYYYDSRVALANARLAIVDLKGGHQPMSAQSERYWIVFNGEIFNYVELRQQLQKEGVAFTDSSDTQVLLHAVIHWGIADAIERFNGQFAFAIYDKQAGSVTFGRDRWGERPLYLYQQNGLLAFASEIRALAALPEITLKLDAKNIARLARLWVPMPDATVFVNITQLPPSHYAIYENGTLSITRYTDKPFQPASLPKNEAEAIEAVKAELTNAVKLRLRSDVEVALYLSGGLDSTITSALGQQLSAGKLRSFSVGFEDAGFDETEYQLEAAKRLGTKHDALRITHADIRTHLPDVVKHAETILFRTAPVPLYLLAKRVHETGIKVVLTGEGSDEIFYGYDIFKEAWFLDQFDSFADDTARAEALGKLYPYLPHFNQRESLALLPFYRNAASRKDVFSQAHLPRITNGTMAASLFSDSGSEDDAITTLEKAVLQIVPNAKTLSPVARSVWAERLTLMHGYLLSSQGDRMSSAHSLEGRYPFLDPAVVALAERLPEQMKLKDGLNEKHILKQAFGALIPESITKRPKQPYRAPGSAALRKGGNDWVDALLNDGIAKSSVLNSESANRIVDQIHRAAPERISPKLDTAYVTLLSTLLLEDQFIHSRTEVGADISALLTVEKVGE